MTNTILITGASSGIGRATAQLFQLKGWNVIATMRDPDKDTELKDLERTLVTRLDVQDIDSISLAVDAGIMRFGRIDALFNNAGYAAYGPLEATPLEKIRRQFDTNVIGLMATTQAVLPYFRKQGAGVILNVSSIGGRIAIYTAGADHLHGQKETMASDGGRRLRQSGPEARVAILDAWERYMHWRASPPVQLRSSRKARRLSRERLPIAALRLLTDVVHDVPQRAASGGHGRDDLTVSEGDSPNSSR